MTTQINGFRMIDLVCWLIGVTIYTLSRFWRQVRSHRFYRQNLNNFFMKTFIQKQRVRFSIKHAVPARNTGRMTTPHINATQIVSETFAENAYIVHNDDSHDCIIIDPGFESEQIIDFLVKNRLTPHAILVTHGHFDHIAGVDVIRSKYKECAVYVSKIDAVKFLDPIGNASGVFGFPITVSVPDFLLNDGDQLDVVGIRIEAFLLPGHSSGHMFFSIQQSTGEQILFVGDVIFMDGIGRSDFPDGNETVLLDGIRDKILTLPDATVLYPGHGPQTTVGRERRYNAFLKNDIC